VQSAAVEDWKEDEAGQTEEHADHTINTVQALPIALELELLLQVNYRGQEQQEEALIQSSDWSIPEVILSPFMGLANATVILIFTATAHQ